MMTRLVRLAAAALIAGSAIAPATATEQQDDFTEIAEGVYVLTHPDPVAAFRLLTQNSQPFDRSGFHGKWSFVFFGFTNCPDFCPATLATFAQVQAALAQRAEAAADVQFVLVSVDPQRDTPARLRAFLDRFGSGFIGLTGDPENLARVADSVGAMYARSPGSSEASYLMDHSSAVLLIDPRARLRAIFAAPHAPSTMVRALLAIRAAAGPRSHIPRQAPGRARATTRAR